MRRSAWNTSSNAFLRAACYPRNGPMSTGMELSPSRPRQPYYAAHCRPPWATSWSGWPYPYLAFDQNYYLADDILVKSDRMSMAHSVEVRPPFLDHRIVEFAATLPAHLKVRGSHQKVLLKDLMRGKLPSSVLRRKKMGFDIPAH